MAVVTHAMVSGKADGPDTSFVQPSDWNAQHVVSDIGTADLGGDITAAGKALLDDADAAAQRTTLGLAAIAASGSGADLAAASVTYAKIQNVSATDKLLGRATAGAGTIEEIACTAAGRALLDDADAAAQRTTLGLAAVASSGSASDLTTGTLPAARIGAASIEDTKLATSATKGRFLARQVLTGSGNYSPTAGTTRAEVWQQAGGGGGGGCGTGTGAAGAAGGNSGFCLHYVVGTAGVTLTGGAFACGAGGTAGAATPTAGGTGGDTTLTVGGSTYTAKGGTGGAAAIRSAAGAVAPAAPAAGSTATDVLNYGQGCLGVWGTGFFFSGCGGPSLLGTGGYSVNGNAAGIAGTKGGGGSGGSSSSIDQAGGAGGAGLIIIDEYT